MVCGSCLRSLIVQTGVIGTILTPKKAHFPSIGGASCVGAGLTRRWNCEFGTRVKMMVDSGAPANRGLMVDTFQQKDDDGKYCSGGWRRGRRTKMEDCFDAKTSEVNGQRVCMFGVFDGHGGPGAAEYLKQNLFENLMKHPKFMTDTKLVITIPLSDDHKPNRSDEWNRIESAGGVIIWAGTWRVGGVLAMSRAFGNRMLKQYVVAEAEIQDKEIDEEFELLVLATDVLWDVVPNEDAVSLAQVEEEPETAARKLTETAFTGGSVDNITCIVVIFHHDKADRVKPELG